MSLKDCSKCQKPLNCGAGTGSCWCMSFPPIMIPNLEEDCLCAKCLSEAMNDRIDTLIYEKGMEQFQKLAKPYRDKSKLIENVDYVIDEGLYVFSKWYLIKQGECCSNGCKNCPY